MWCGLSANLECRSDMCCTWLAENTGCKKSPKIRHHHTSLSGCIFLSKAPIYNRKQNLLKSNLTHMSSQYGELRPTSGWDQFGSFGHPTKFQWVLCLGSITARHSSSGRQANFAVLKRGCHLYSAGRPSCWALAYILIMAAVCNRAGHYIFALWFLSSSSSSFSRLISGDGDWMSTTLPHMLWP